MTEVERILAKGQFNESFLKAETLCDYEVDENKKKLWLVGLDLLAELDSVCRRHGLKYFLFFGSLLGAIRHNGFIPWDDDIDVAMPRDDYDKLVLYRDELKSPYFLQTPTTDEGYFFSFNKLRNSNTTNISLPFKYEHFNQGICLDIFPIDSYTTNGLEEKFQRIKELVIDLSTYMRMRNPELDEADRQRVLSYSGRKPEETFQMIQDICLADRYIPSETAGYISGNVYGAKKQTFCKEYMDEVIEHSFYGLPVFIPKHYDGVLTTLYGDYMAFPPKEKRGTWHHDCIIDTDKPYHFYLK